MTDDPTAGELPAEADTDSLEELRSRPATGLTRPEPEDEANVPEDFELAGADLSGEFGDLVGDVLPRQADEFACPRCFLVRHRSQRVPARDHCRDCD